MSNNAFETSDLALAAYLVILGYPILYITYENGSRGTLGFKDDPKRPELVMRFFNRQTTVEPIAFLDHVKSLKAMLKQKNERA